MYKHVYIYIYIYIYVYSRRCGANGCAWQTQQVFASRVTWVAASGPLPPSLLEIAGLLMPSPSRPTTPTCLVCGWVNTFNESGDRRTCGANRCTCQARQVLASRPTWVAAGGPLAPSLLEVASLLLPSPSRPTTPTCLVCGWVNTCLESGGSRRCGANGCTWQARQVLASRVTWVAASGHLPPSLLEVAGLLMPSPSRPTPACLVCGWVNTCLESGGSIGS